MRCRSWANGVFLEAGQESSRGEGAGSAVWFVTLRDAFLNRSCEPIEKPWNLASTTLQVVLRIDWGEFEEAVALAGMSSANVWQ